MAVFHVTLPPGCLSREGGGAYVTKLAAALTAAGHVVHLGGPPPPASIRIVDGAALARLPLDQAPGAIGLVHHTTPLADRALHDALHAAERERLPLLRSVVATSELVRDRLVAECGADPGRIAVLPPGVPDVPRSAGSGGQTCVLLSVGALVPRKGHAVLLHALARLFDLAWQLVIVGDTTRDPAHAAALRAQSETPGLDGRVRFAGSLDDAALDAEWQRADMFALATEWEGYSAPVAEALRRGLPVAVTNGGAASDLVSPELGVVAPPNDPDQLSKALRRVIFDTALRADMAEAAWCAGRALPDWPTQAAHFARLAQP